MKKIKVFSMDVLRELTSVPGISGDEKGIRDKIKEHLAKLKNINRVEVDNVGNLFAFMDNGAKDTVMINAHMDTPGMRVTRILDGRPDSEVCGKLLFQDIGLSRSQMTNTRVRVHGTHGDIPGIIASKGVHLAGHEEYISGEEQNLNRMVIDIGARAYKEVEKMGIEIGTPVTFDMPLTLMNGRYVTGPFLDNRIGVSILLAIAKELVKKELDINIIFSFSTKEESDLSGIESILHCKKPASIIVIDTTTADQYDLDPHMITPDIDNGCAVEIGTFANKKLFELVKEISKKHKEINWQTDIVVDPYTTGCTESWPAGKYNVPAITLSVPTKYLHTEVEMLSIADVIDTMNLTRELLYKIKSGMKYID